MSERLPTRAEGRLPVTRSVPASFLGALLAGAILGFATLCAVYAGLYAADSLPPPPLSNNLCVDQKLAFMRDHPPEKPNILTIGSSVAWRNFDSSIVVQEVPGARPLNAGFCGMRTNQAAFIADWLIGREPTIKQVLLIASPLDYKECDQSGQIFDVVDTDKFVYEREWKWGFYLRYFDPLSLARNSAELLENREEDRTLGFALEFTTYGDGPMDTGLDRGLFYGPMQLPEAACLVALRSLAEKLVAEGRRFMVVMTPLHPGWNATYDPRGTFRQEITRRLAAALEGTGAEMWDADAANLFDPSAFVDAVHIRWSKADAFTEAIVRHFAI